MSVVKEAVESESLPGEVVLAEAKTSLVVMVADPLLEDELEAEALFPRLLSDDGVCWVNEGADVTVFD